MKTIELKDKEATELITVLNYLLANNILTDNSELFKTIIDEIENNKKNKGGNVDLGKAFLK